MRMEAILSKPLSAPLGSVKRCILAAAVTIAVAGPVALGLANPAGAEPVAALPAAATGSLVTSPATAPTTSAAKFSTTHIVRGEDSRPATISAEPDAFIAVNATVRDLVRFAYGQRLPPQVSGGPAWLDNERYTIHANVDSGAATDESTARAPASIQERVRWLLENRFRFRAHLTKVPVYVLESAPDAPESSQKPVEKGIGLIDKKSGSVSFKGASSASVAEALSTFLASQVLDHTKPGVTYDFKMKWPRNDLKALGDRLHDQAGLVLRSFTMEQLVIEAVERPALDSVATEQIVAR
jgi:uncharacterized protein (TIGR03435 family)